MKKNFSRTRQKIAYSVKIEETINMLGKKHRNTFSFDIGQSSPEAIPCNFLRNTFALLSKATDSELRPMALYGSDR